MSQADQASAAAAAEAGAAPVAPAAKQQKLAKNDDRHNGGDADPSSSSTDYLTRLKAVGRIVSSHPVIHEAISRTLDACKQRAPSGLFERDKMLAASVRMKVVRKTIDCIIEDNKSMDALMAAYRDVSNRLEREPTNEDLREAMSSKHVKKIDGLIADAAHATRESFEGNLDAFFASRETRMQEKVDASLERKAAASSAKAGGGGAGGGKQPRGRGRGKKRGATEDAGREGGEEKEEGADDADGGVLDGGGNKPAMPSPLRACSAQELAAIAGAKRVAEQFAQLCPLGKRMFECFVSAAGAEQR